MNCYTTLPGSEVASTETLPRRVHSGTVPIASGDELSTNYDKIIHSLATVARLTCSAAPLLGASSV